MENGRLYIIFSIFGILIILLIYLLTSRQFQSGQISYNCLPGKTAFYLLQEKTNQAVKYQQSSFGKMVTSINGIEQANGKYWIYLVSGKEATISADAYICLGEEIIAWELK